MAAFGTTFAAAAAQIAIAVANLRWYDGLHRPSFSPGAVPAAATAIAVAGVSGAAFLRILELPDYHPDRPAAVRVFFLGTALDVLWTALFFGGRHPTVSFAAAGGLVAVAIATVWRFAAVDRRAGLLAVPRVAAAVFAFLLALSISTLNGPAATPG